MNDTLVQGLIWLGAFGVLFTFLRRRRTRRTQH
jgi:hypothetical protein